MTIVVTIKPEAETELNRQAAAAGLSLDEFAARLLEKAAAGERPDEQRRLKFLQTLKELAQFSDKMPVLREEAFSRESIYQDHD